MSSSRSLLLIILVSISLHTSSSSSSVETLLQSQIVSAQCSAWCSVETGLARLLCLEVCPMVVSSPSSSLVCGLTHLCSTGCRTACTAGEEQQVSLSSLHLGHCLLTWTLSSTQSVVILLVGQDQGGMWHLVGTVTDSAFPRHLVARYSTVKILVIRSCGLVDTAQVTVERKLEEQEDCRKTQTSPDSQHLYFKLHLATEELPVPGCARHSRHHLRNVPHRPQLLQEEQEEEGADTKSSFQTVPRLQDRVSLPPPSHTTSS